MPAFQDKGKAHAVDAAAKVNPHTNQVHRTNIHPACHARSGRKRAMAFFHHCGNGLL